MKLSNSGPKLPHDLHQEARSAVAHRGVSLGTTRRAVVYLRFLICAFCMLFGPGALSCDLEQAEADYRNNPDATWSKINYYNCLIQKGETSRGARGLEVLWNFERNVAAAYIVAFYTRTRGKNWDGDSGHTDDYLEDALGGDSIEAIDAYSRVKYYIDLDTDYPTTDGTDDAELYEREWNIELSSHRSHSTLWLDKFIKGVVGDHNRYVEASPSFHGQMDLKVISEDYTIYTMDSLNRAIVEANNCLNLPQKQHFRPDRYTLLKKFCQIVKEAAQTLIPLEEKRKMLLNQESCRRDVLKCEELNQVVSEIRSLYIKQHSDGHEVYEQASAQAETEAEAERGNASDCVTHEFRGRGVYYHFFEPGIEGDRNSHSPPSGAVIYYAFANHEFKNNCAHTVRIFYQSNSRQEDCRYETTGNHGFDQTFVAPGDTKRESSIFIEKGCAARVKWCADWFDKSKDMNVGEEIAYEKEFFRSCVHTISETKNSLYGRGSRVGG